MGVESLYLAQQIFVTRFHMQDATRQETSFILIATALPPTPRFPDKIRFTEP